MANELNIALDPIGDTGLTVVGKIFSAGFSQQGSDVAMSETSAGMYTGSFTLSSLADGVYRVVFIDDDTGTLLGDGKLYVRGGVEYLSPTVAEISDGVWDETRSAQLLAIETKAQADARQALLIAEIDANEAKIDTTIADTAIIKTSITGETLRLQKISAQIGDLK